MQYWNFFFSQYQLLYIHQQLISLFFLMIWILFYKHFNISIVFCLIMEVEIDLHKSVEENAGMYFDQAKKYKKKLEGARKALLESRKKLADLEKQEEKFQAEEVKKLSKVERKKEWYEKFHWFVSSEGYLCIGGKDATSNEVIIKKHMEKDDVVFHT